MNIDVSSKSL